MIHSNKHYLLLALFLLLIFVSFTVTANTMLNPMGQNIGSTMSASQVSHPAGLGIDWF
ncbi:hypothetical protein [Shewanella sp.]|uniref:hypothetical protein n=1 Tax=Shewanella sp. TaxID=50422 RepID=UPI001EBE360F|nr:hypothetical protein [Shewanella sp.]NRB23274.1 hypothetical protein [Shewanella sp.]